RSQPPNLWRTTAKAFPITDQLCPHLCFPHRRPISSILCSMLGRFKKHTASLMPPVFPTGNVQPSYAWSLRLYVQEIFLKFRSIVGIALLLLGYVADLVSGFKVPPVVFGILFACGF